MSRSAAIRRRLALVLALILLLSGCSLSGGESHSSGRDPVSFDQMEYTRPDMDALEALFSSVTGFAETATRRDGDALTEKLSRCWDAYDEFYTMDTLAMLRSDIDQSDEAAAAEYEFCQSSEVLMDAWLDALLAACANSEAPVPSNLLAGYDQGDVEPYTDRQLELMGRENELLMEYWRAMMLDEIRLDGRTVSYTEYISDPRITSEEYRTANLAYARACNETAAPVYVELIKVRRAMAEEFGYGSYEDLQFDTFARDYTPDQVHRYLDDVASAVAGFSAGLMDQDPYSLVSYDPPSATSLLNLLRRSIADMGEPVIGAYDLMKTYRLYDVSASVNKAPGAYTVYLDSYDVPFCFLGAYGDVEDFLDLSHEFGHFVDAYVNYNATASLDLAELYSQAMANLTLLKCRDLMSEGSYRNLLLLHLLSNLNVFTEQAAYADFETRAFQLPDEELTVETLNALALACAERFGAVTPGEEELSSLYWAQVSHLFEYPFYVISYCVSADAALQIAELERDDSGTGVACYEGILDWAEDAFLSELARVGLESPFSPGRPARALALAEAILEEDLAEMLNAA